MVERVVSVSGVERRGIWGVPTRCCTYNGVVAVLDVKDNLSESPTRPRTFNSSVCRPVFCSRGRGR